MAAMGLRSVVVKKYNHHANQGAVPDDRENILKRDFTAESISQKWCTDITYIHVLKEGWTYPASVMDLCSRKIIGYACGTSMTAKLAVQAVKNACLNVKETEENPVTGFACKLFCWRVEPAYSCLNFKPCGLALSSACRLRQDSNFAPVTKQINRTPPFPAK